MANQFQHQQYTSQRPTSPHHLLRPGTFPDVTSADFRRRMAVVGRTLAQQGVAAIYLAHGTFAGHDALGLLGELGRWFPTASDAARRVIKQMIDALAAETGNYTGAFAQLFQDSLSQGADREIPVRRFHWSSENHHIGRADGAVRLIDELNSLELQPGQRIVLWGHSHAGNVFALLTNLLSRDRESVERFFAATEVYYRWPLLGCVDIPLWRKMREQLTTTDVLSGVALDICTFGTPIRYGWDADGYSHLLHFINHRPVEGLPDWQAPFPPQWDRVMEAVDGDYVQQFGIAGTNIMPSLLSWRAWLADMRLSRLLQEQLPTKDLLNRLGQGTRVPQAGTTLLVDYGKPGGSIAQHAAGHALYTRREWLLFHVEEMTRRFYTSPDQN